MKLNETQAALLAEFADAPTLATETYHGHTINALVKRELVTISGDTMSTTDAGRKLLERAARQAKKNGEDLVDAILSVASLADRPRQPPPDGAPVAAAETGLTRQLYHRLRCELEQRHRDDLAALERVWEIASRVEREP